MWTNHYSGDDSELPAKKTMFETNILKFSFSKGHLILIFVVLQIKIIHIHLSMSRMIDRVFYNSVEIILQGTPCTLRKFLPFSPPPHPLGICIDHPCGGGGWVCVINNDLSFDNFRLERGVRQGDLLSPCLLVPAAEVLAVSIRQNSHIRGISIGNKET